MDFSSFFTFIDSECTGMVTEMLPFFFYNIYKHKTGGR